MGSKVVVREGEAIHDALRRLQRKVNDKFSRSWYKSRVGYYEKPSTRKRRKQGTAAYNRRTAGTVVQLKVKRKSLTGEELPQQCVVLTPLKMKMGLKWLYERKRPWP